MVPWKGGRVLVWDVTCADTLAPSHRQLASREAGAVAASAEQRKKSKYAHLEATHLGEYNGTKTELYRTNAKSQGLVPPGALWVTTESKEDQLAWSYGDMGWDMRSGSRKLALTGALARHPCTRSV